MNNLRLIPVVAIFFLLIGHGSTAKADDWPQWLGPERDGIWRESGIIETFPESGPEIKWRVPIGGGYSGPAVAKGKVYLTDRLLDPEVKNPSNPFSTSSIPGKERILCLNEEDGFPLWIFEYDCNYGMSYPAGPRATPLIRNGKVYTLGAEGKLLCLNADKGTLIWERDFKNAGHPLLVKERLICLVGGKPDALVVAFDPETGKEIWKALTAKEPGYCPPTLIHHGGKNHLIIWHPESINALNPETGKLSWSLPFKVQSGLSISTPRLSGDKLFITAFYNGSRMYQMDPAEGTPKLLWKSVKSSEKDTSCLHSIMCTPTLYKDHIYGVCSYGQLRCLDLKTGTRKWETFEATTRGKPVRWANAFIVQQADQFFLFNELGDLIIAKMSPEGYREISRTHLLKPTGKAGRTRNVVWSHPAFANKHMFARNDEELIRVSLEE